MLPSSSYAPPGGTVTVGGTVRAGGALSQAAGGTPFVPYDAVWRRLSSGYVYEVVTVTRRPTADGYVRSMVGGASDWKVLFLPLGELQALTDDSYAVLLRPRPWAA